MHRDHPESPYRRQFISSRQQIQHCTLFHAYASPLFQLLQIALSQHTFGDCGCVASGFRAIHFYQDELPFTCTQTQYSFASSKYYVTQSGFANITLSMTKLKHDADAKKDEERWVYLLHLTGRRSKHQEEHSSRTPQPEGRALGKPGRAQRQLVRPKNNVVLCLSVCLIPPCRKIQGQLFQVVPILHQQSKCPPADVSGVQDCSDVLSTSCWHHHTLALSSQTLPYSAMMPSLNICVHPLPGSPSSW